MIIVPTEGIVFTVGRFQTDELTHGHRMILDLVNQAKYPLCFIGSANQPRSRKNPLHPEAVRYMIKTDYPRMTITTLNDIGQKGNSMSDRQWSESLDAAIRVFANEDQIDENHVCGVSGYDGFGQYYSGDFQLIRLPRPKNPIHSTKIRESIGRGEIPVQLAERRAMIWLAEQVWEAK